MSKNKIFLPCHSIVKWCNPGDFLKAQFVIFRCQKYVKKAYMEMRKWIYLVPLGSVLGRSILHFWWEFPINVASLFFVLKDIAGLWQSTQQTFAGLQDVLKTCLEDVCKTYWRQIKCFLKSSVSNKSKYVSNKSGIS